MFAALGLLALGCLLIVCLRWRDRRNLALFEKLGGPAAADRMGIELPGVNVGSDAAGRKSLPPAQQTALQKPATLVSARKAKDFWGLQAVPEVDVTGVKSLDKVIKPGGQLVVGMTKMHNAIFHISNSIKSFAAMRLGAAEIGQVGLKHGLPVLEIFKTSAETGARTVLAKIDCEGGLQVLVDADFRALDNEGQKFASTALIRSFAEWLVFAKRAMSVKDDMDIELLDARAAIPLLCVADNEYQRAAPWVTTQIRYGGWFGFCKTEREISLEELIQRSKARTESGRRANKRAAKAQSKKLEHAEKESAHKIVVKKKEIQNLSGAERVNAVDELDNMQRASAEERKMHKVIKSYLRPFSRRGFNITHTRPLENLAFVDPREGSKSKLLYESSGGRKGWVRQRLGPIGWYCYMWHLQWKLCRMYACACCIMAHYACSNPKPAKRTKHELKLLSRMKTEQKRRDGNIKKWIELVNESTAQLNRLLPMIQKNLLNSTGYKLDLRSSIALVKRDLVEMCATQPAAAAKLSTKAIAKSAGGGALMQMMEQIRPQFQLDTDFSLLKEGKSPIVDFTIDFKFPGDDDDDDAEEGGSGEADGAGVGREMAELAAKRLLISKLRPNLEPSIIKLGLEWASVAEKLEGLEAAEIEAAAANPDAYVEELAHYKAAGTAEDNVDKAVEAADGKATQLVKKASSGLQKKGFQIDVASLPPHFKRLYELLFDHSSKHNLVSILKEVAKDFLGVVTNAAKLIYQVANLARKCLPPTFPIVADVSKDIGMLVMELDFKLRLLPFKLAKALRQLLLLPRDLVRFAGSVKSLVTVMRAAFSNKGGAIDLAPQLLRLEMKDGKVIEEKEDAELEATGRTSEGDIDGVLGNALANAAGDATDASQTLAEVPDEPPPGLKITVDDGAEGGGRGTVADEDAAAEDEDGDDDREDEDEIEGDPAAPEPISMVREARESISRARASSRAPGKQHSVEVTNMKPDLTSDPV